LQEGRIAPDRVLLESGSGERPFELVQVGRDDLLGTIPSEVWKQAESVRLAWETPTGTRLAPTPIVPHDVSVESGLRMEECGVRLVIEPHSVYDDFPIQCDLPEKSPPPAEEMVLLGGPLRLRPEGVPVYRKGTLTFPLPADPHPERIGIYRLDPSGRSWVFEGGEQDKGEIRLAIGRLDTFALLRDDSPPRVMGVEPSGSTSISPARAHFRIPVEDRGSGLNYDGVHFFLDGLELETEYDPDRGWSTASPQGPLSPGLHAGSVWAVDRAGTRSKAAACDVRVR
jgi:hypothetical protein